MVAITNEVIETIIIQTAYLYASRDEYLPINAIESDRDSILSIWWVNGIAELIYIILIEPAILLSYLMSNTQLQKYKYCL